jgi:hypothetical protein
MNYQQWIPIFILTLLCLSVLACISLQVRALFSLILFCHEFVHVCVFCRKPRLLGRKSQGVLREAGETCQRGYLHL